MINDRNGKDLTEAEEMKRWQAHTEELYKKGLNDLHAKSLHLYLTLCFSVNCSLPGFSVQGVLQARILE